MEKRHSPRSLCQGGLWAALLLLSLCVGLVGCGGGSGGSSSSTTLTAPTITAQPTSQTVAVGSTISMGVTASGTSVNYQWYKDAVAISGATSATYSISSAATTDAGAYYVIVSNSAGQTQSSSVTVTVSATTGSGTVTIQ